MRLIRLVVRNFRGLEEIDVSFDNRVNVIVGPNAIGKTTVLETIRLAKALLAPRTQNETQSTLQSLRISVPHYPQRIFPEAVARDIGKLVEVQCHYEIGDIELGKIESSIPQIATDLVLSNLGRAFASPGASLSFLSSPPGKEMLAKAEETIKTATDGFRSHKRQCNLNVSIDPAGRFDGGDPVDAAVFSFLDLTLPPNRTIFSYFPADRALPFGEVPVQLGLADAQQQIESYVSQPQLKFQRLKNTIFNAVIASEDERNGLFRDFQQIFEGVLKGRKFHSVGVNEHGLLSIRVQDTETGRFFDLDAMSSGEKGLVLTFLLIGRSIADGGIILIDEPELHLNPAVQRNLLRFLVEEYVVPKNLHAIICSHSPEILAGAFDSDHCSLFHLASEKMLTKVRRKDEDEITQALRRLGTSESEGLLYKATIFVEGEEDIELIEAGFADLLRRYKLKDLGGRREIEKQITLLQQGERQGTTLPPCYFVFDRDEMPTNLRSSGSVRILQWGRRCLENYLIDIETLTDILQDQEVVQQRVSNLGEVNKLLRDLALSQLDEIAAKDVYMQYPFEDPKIRAAEIQQKNIDEIAEILMMRLRRIGQQTSKVGDDWKASFVAESKRKKEELLAIWDVKWMEDCDGKRLFRDLHRRLTFRMSSRRLRKRIVQEMGRKRTENWRAVESLLTSLLA